MKSPNQFLNAKVANEKSTLSSRVSFFSHITDLVFAVLVWAVFLSIALGLHIYFGKFLDNSKFLFVLGLVELAVLSFGAVWCVLFFIKGFCRQKQTGQVKSELLHSPRGNVIRRFLGIVIKQPISYFVFSLIVLTVFCCNISFAEMAQDNADDLSIFACELLCETGPDFPQTADNCAIMLANYSKYLEPKYIPGFLKIFTGGNSAENSLRDAVKNLENVKGSHEDVAKSIWRTGEKIMFSRLKILRSLPQRIRLLEYRKVSDALLCDIRKAVENSREAMKLFEEKPSLDNAINSCEANRASMFLIFLARKSRQNQIFDEFQGIVEECRERKIEAASGLPEDDPRKEFVTMTAKFEQRRIEILEALKEQNTQKAIGFMWEAIEEAYFRRARLLELSEKLRNMSLYKPINF